MSSKQEGCFELVGWSSGGTGRRGELRDEEVEGDSTRQGRRPAEGCDQQRHVKVDPTKDVTTIGQAWRRTDCGGDGGGEESSLLATMGVFSHRNVVILRDFNLSEQTDRGLLC